MDAADDVVSTLPCPATFGFGFGLGREGKGTRGWASVRLRLRLRWVWGSGNRRRRGVDAVDEDDRLVEGVGVRRHGALLLVMVMRRS